MMDGSEVEAVARRVAELLRRHVAEPERLIDAAEAARRLRVSRATIYAKANELGALRLGHGPKARLRFDPSRIHDALPARPAEGPGPARWPSARRRRRRARSDGSSLLPIRGRIPQ
jgi:hypothetical protein